MKVLLLSGIALLLCRSMRRRRRGAPADHRFDVLIASTMLVASGIAMLTIAWKVGRVGIGAGLAGLGMLAFLGLGLMKLRR